MRPDIRLRLRVRGREVVARQEGGEEEDEGEEQEEREEGVWVLGSWKEGLGAVGVVYFWEGMLAGWRMWRKGLGSCEGEGEGWCGVVWWA